MLVHEEYYIKYNLGHLNLIFYNILVIRHYITINFVMHSYFEITQIK